MAARRRVFHCPSRLPPAGRARSPARGRRNPANPSCFILLLFLFRMDNLLIAALYKFVRLPDYASMRMPLLACCETNGVKGTLLLAVVGLNGTIAGEPEGVAAVLAFLPGVSRFRGLRYLESWRQAESSVGKGGGR